MWEEEGTVRESGKKAGKRRSGEGRTRMKGRTRLTGAALTAAAGRGSVRAIDILVRGLKRLSVRTYIPFQQFNEMSAALLLVRVRALANKIHKIFSAIV